MEMELTDHQFNGGDVIMFADEIHTEEGDGDRKSFKMWRANADIVYKPRVLDEDGAILAHPVLLRLENVESSLVSDDLEETDLDKGAEIDYRDDASLEASESTQEMLDFMHYEASKIVLQQEPTYQDDISVTWDDH